jgi:phage/plasmid-like protein (TIGR03299 family)
MAHELEMVNGKAQMAYAGETPWHGLGKSVPADLTPYQMLEAAGLDWTVHKVPAFANVGGVNINVGHSALVRTRNDEEDLLDVVSNDWNPVQNLEAAEFFNDFVMEGDMEMHTAGSLKGGQIVWFLAKVKDGFSLFGGDEVESYLQFSNFHKYGFSTDIRFTPIRVVCNNTLTLSLNSKVERFAKISHRREFNGDNVKEMLGIAADKLAQYKEMAAFLGSKRYTNENLVEYFKTVFPITGANRREKEMSRSAATAMDIIDTQPGANFAPGSWWNAFNTVTYMTDHLLGRSDDGRLASAWYGPNKTVKTNALETALEMANAA